MSNLTDLIERVERLTGSDREIDLAIHMELCPSEYEGKWSWDDDSRPPHLTGSLDSAVTLAQRALPGRPVFMGWCQTPETLPWARVGSWKEHDATGPTPAIALVLATLRALQGKADE